MNILTNRLILSLVTLCALPLTSPVLGGCVTETSVYDAAVAEGTPDALHDYLEAFPEGRYAPLARPDLDELRWLEATADPTADAYEAYLEHHPDGIHSQEARAAAPALAWREMDLLDDRQAIEAFLVKYEHSFYGTKASDDWFGDVEHVRLVLSTLVLADG